MYDLIENPSTKVAYMLVLNSLVGLSGKSLPLWPSATAWPVVGQIESFAQWKKSPGGYGPTDAVALVELRDANCVTVGGNVLAILGWIEDMQGELIRWVNSYNCRNAARAAAEVKL